MIGVTGMVLFCGCFGAGLLPNHRIETFDDNGKRQSRCAA